MIKLKFAQQGKTVIYNIIKMTMMSQKGFDFESEKLVVYRYFVAAFATKFSFNGWCPGLSELFGTHEVSIILI